MTERADISLRRRVAGACGLACVVWLGAVAAGAEAGDAATTPARMQLLDFMFSGPGGIIEMVILACSVAVLSLTADYFFTIRFGRHIPPDVLDLIRRDVVRGELHEIVSVCEENPCFFTNVMLAGLHRRKHGLEIVRTTVEDATEKEAARLHGRIGYIAFISNIAPMLGLLGTVVGMIGAFSKIGYSDAASRFASLAGDIAIALITTATGLLVAIPAMTIFFFFRNRINKIVLDVDTEVMEMMEKLVTPRSSSARI